jgi:hypothetical protein
MSRDDSRDQIVTEQVKNQYDEEISLHISNNGRDFLRKTLVICRRVRRRVQNNREETSEEQFCRLLQRARVLSARILISLGKRHEMDSNLCLSRIHDQRPDVNRFMILLRPWKDTPGSAVSNSPCESQNKYGQYRTGSVSVFRVSSKVVSW